MNIPDSTNWTGEQKERESCYLYSVDFILCCLIKILTIRYTVIFCYKLDASTHITIDLYKRHAIKIHLIR